MTKPPRDPRTGRFVAAPKTPARPPETYIRRDQLPPLDDDRILAALDGRSTKQPRVSVAAYDNGPLVTARSRKHRWPRVLAAVLLLALAAAIAIALTVWARR